MRNACARFSLALAVCVLAGCSDSGPDVVPVSGTVTYQGKPLEDARVMFHPQGEGARSSYGTTDAEGRFELSTFGANDGALLGKHTVTVGKADLSAEGEIDAKALQEGGYAGGGMPGYDAMMGGGAGTKIEVKSQIPERYADKTTSKLEAEVMDDGKNDFTFDLE